MDSGEQEESQEKPVSVNSNSNAHILSDKDVKISFGFEDAEESDAKETARALAETKPDAEPTINDAGEDNKDKLQMEEWLEQVEEERSQWDAIDRVQETSSAADKSSSDVSFSELFDYFKMKEMDKSDIRPTIERTGFSALIHFLFGPPKLNRSLVDDRDAVFCIAQVQFQDSEQIHERVLQTIYKKLTGSKFGCPRRGSHWETVGFQGDDPATDLRGIGFLGLMQVLYGLDNGNVSSLFNEFYRLSLHEEQNFPFCVMSFNVTRIVLQVLREEKLNKEMNKAKEVFEILNYFYVAVFHYIFHIWKTQYKTMKDSGNVILDAEKTARRSPKQLLKALESALKERREKRQVTSTPSAPPDCSHSEANPTRKISISSSEDSNSRIDPSDLQPVSFKTDAELTAGITAEEIERFTNIQSRVRNEPVTDL